MTILNSHAVIDNCSGTTRSCRAALDLDGRGRPPHTIISDDREPTTDDGFLKPDTRRLQPKARSSCARLVPSPHSPNHTCSCQKNMWATWPARPSKDWSLD